MGCKRKHSSNGSPLSVSSFGTVSTLDAQSPQLSSLSHHATMDLDAQPRSNAWDFVSASRVKSSDWGNRTCKRVRDNRPDERAIHENTLNKLYSAQRNQRDIPTTTCQPLPVQLPTVVNSKPQKSTLHSFWKQLPAPPVQPIFTAIAQPDQSDLRSTRCEDCDTPLQSDNDSMDIDMDTAFEAVDCSPFACSDCGRSVCGTCAVVLTTRHCLQCATIRRNSTTWR